MPGDKATLPPSGPEPVTAWGGGQVAERSYQTVPGLLALRVAATPDAAAFAVEQADGRWEPLTWAAFAGRAQRLSAALAAAGLGPGDRLALIAPVSLEWELLHHAALALGAVVVGMDPHDLPERIAGMVEQADIVAFASAAPEALRDVAAARWRRCQLAVSMPGCKGEWPPGVQAVKWEALRDRAASVPVDGARAIRGPGPDDLATIVFTSGTTGVPKGIAYRHAQVCLAIESIRQTFPFVGPGSRLLCWLPLSNLFQRIVNLAALCQGATSFLLADPRRVMEVTGAVAPDVFVAVPRFYEKLYQGLKARIADLPAWQRQLVLWAWAVGRRSSPYRQPGGRRMPSLLRWQWAFADRVVLHRLRRVLGGGLRCLVSGSAAMPRPLLEEFHALGWLLLEAYGQSESVVPIAMNRTDAYRFGSVGRPTGGQRVRITEEGIVAVQGPGVFEGYLGVPEPGAGGERLTGDIGRIDADGFLWLEGRADDLIKTSTGRRIAPGPIETRLAAVSGVEQALVFGNGRKRTWALCACDPGHGEGAGRDRLMAAVVAALEGLAAAERPETVLLLPRPLSIAAGELTSNLKPRRRLVEGWGLTYLDAAGAGQGQGVVVQWLPAEASASSAAR